MNDYQIYTDPFAGFTNLFYMAPETSQIEPEKVRQTFISNLVVDSAKRPTVNMSIWNGPIHTWNADYLTIDENMKIHGSAVLNLPTDHFNDTGKSFSEALIFASINPQYDNRLFMELT